MERMKKAEAMKLLERIGRAIKELPEDVRIGRLFMVSDGKGVLLERGIHEAAEVFGKTVEAWPGWNEKNRILRFEVDGLVFCQLELKRKGHQAEGQEIEMAEVVRCQRCAKRNTPDCAMWYQCEVCGGQWSWETDEDFCSRGELKQ